MFPVSTPVNAFSGVINMFSLEPVIVLRATKAGGFVEARKQARGLERHMSGNRFGAYEKSNRDRFEVRAVITAQSERQQKDPSGERREAGLRYKSQVPIYATDDSRGTYSDLVLARGDTWRVQDVSFDNVARIYSATLIKVSDDFSVDTGA